MREGGRSSNGFRSTTSKHERARSVLDARSGLRCHITPLHTSAKGAAETILLTLFTVSLKLAPGGPEPDRAGGPTKSEGRTGGISNEGTRGGA